MKNGVLSSFHLYILGLTDPFKYLLSYFPPNIHTHMFYYITILESLGSLWQCGCNLFCLLSLLRVLAPEVPVHQSMATRFLLPITQFPKQLSQDPNRSVRLFCSAQTPFPLNQFCGPGQRRPQVAILMSSTVPSPLQSQNSVIRPGLCLLTVSLLRMGSFFSFLNAHLEACPPLADLSKARRNR